MKHTKGSWVATRGSHKYPLEITTETRTIAQIEIQKTIEEIDANAQLIAAAPYLLVVCEEARKLLSDVIIPMGAKKQGTPIYDTIKEIEAAIAKAKGD